jgi:hypothetical protein
MYNEWRRYLDLTHVLYLYSVKIGSTAASRWRSRCALASSSHYRRAAGRTVQRYHSYLDMSTPPWVSLLPGGG